MRALVPYSELEIGQRNPLWQPPTFYLSQPRGLNEYALVKILSIYEGAPKPVDQPLIVGLRDHTRRRALVAIKHIAHTCADRIRLHDAVYTIHWWSRTLSNAHAGELVVAFRLLGIYELSHPSS